jgi:hypothetical protein
MTTCHDIKNFVFNGFFHRQGKQHFKYTCCVCDAHWGKSETGFYPMRQKKAEPTRTYTWRGTAEERASMGPSFGAWVNKHLAEESRNK